MSRKLLSEKNNKKEQSLISHLVYFVTTEDTLKGFIINIKSAKYSFASNTLTIGYTTLEGKYGTVKEKLGKSSRLLSDYLFSLNLYRTPPIIQFKIQKEDEAIERVKSLLEKLDKNEI
jgi:archaellum biogenesis ATPase FlaH